MDNWMIVAVDNNREITILQLSPDLQGSGIEIGFDSDEIVQFPIEPVVVGVYLVDGVVLGFDKSGDPDTASGSWHAKWETAFN